MSSGMYQYMGVVYMCVLIVIGILSLFFATALFFFPHQLRKMNEVGNRILFTDGRAIIYRKIAGLVLIALSAIFFIVGYVVSAR